MLRTTLPLLLGLTACKPEQNISRLTPQIAVTPIEVDFGGVVVDYADTQTIEILNAGRADLELDDLRIEGDQAQFFKIPKTVDVVAPDERVELDLELWPKTYVEYTGNLMISSNDEESPLLEIPLMGEGIAAPTPDIQLSTQVLEFDAVNTGVTDVQWFEIKNVGDDDLLISNMTQLGAGSFVVQGDPIGAVLAPEESTQIVVLYTPEWDKGDNGTLTLDSNDPDEPQVAVTLIGNGGGDYDYPVAVIDGPNVAEILDTVQLDGTGSYDPNGLEPLVYEWSVNQGPFYVDAEVQDPAGSTTGLWLNEGGTWRVQLQVTNTIGVKSAPASHTINVRPEDAIWVELLWNTSEADLDLHLADGLKTEFYDVPGDVSHCNPNPEWGGSGALDDPVLVLDDLAGFGPEDIKIESPADGEYPVRAYFYDDWGDGTVVATVNVWINGNLEHSVSESLVMKDLWEVGYVRWPEAVFVDIPGDVTPDVGRGGLCD